MSTTVNYKGNTIATLSNETKTLTTAGTWVEEDISITDSGGTAAISVVDTTDSHGGTIREITAIDISDTTAVASDVAVGKYFYTAQGVKTAGTGSGGTPSAAQHTIYFEFSDNTNTTITAYYDDSFISSAITATTPTTYESKTVELAQLDGVTWYEVGDIPLNTELVDYTSVKTGYVVEDNGEIVADEVWECVTDYIPISPSMTFTFKLSNYDNVGFYDLNKNMVRVISSDFLAEEAVGNYVIGTLNSTNIPSNAAYIVIPGNSYDLQNSLSLIRTA